MTDISYDFTSKPKQAEASTYCTKQPDTFRAPANCRRLNGRMPTMRTTDHRLSDRVAFQREARASLTLVDGWIADHRRRVDDLPIGDQCRTGLLPYTERLTSKRAELAKFLEYR